MVTESLAMVEINEIQRANPLKRMLSENNTSNKRTNGKSTSLSLDKIITEELRFAHKRKRGRDDQDDGTIHLGEVIHRHTVTHLLRPALKFRFYGN